MDQRRASRRDGLSPSRRAFLRVRTQEPHLRPPWALGESSFRSLCTGCGDCVAACPAQVLKRSEDGYPVFDPALGECTFCQECVKACAPLALNLGVGRPWEIKAQIASTCLALNGVTCFSCRDACGETAIRFRPAHGGAQPEVDEARCTGCGGCVGVCPVSALSLVPAAVGEGSHGE